MNKGILILAIILTVGIGFLNPLLALIAAGVIIFKVVKGD